MRVRVRFAPSPTGMLHIGAFRDALFKQLFALHNHGVNILRIEDTDRTRYNPESEEEIIGTLAWAGISFEEGPHVGGPHAPYRQSERKEVGIYDHWIKKLLKLGGAYKAFETPEELQELREVQEINKKPTGYFGGEWRDASQEKVTEAELAGKPYVIRQKIRRNRTIEIEDAIRGKIEWDSNTIDDPVLIKADGMPTYHFASMVDDHLMEITHIMRGEEWISSAPKHAELFDLFGWERPIFVHLPVILGNDGKKLSKRHGATRVFDYASEGYLPHSLKNFVALIGWSPGDDREELSEAELIEAFEIKGIQPAPGRFQLDKLKWLNGLEIRRFSPEDLLEKILDYANNPATQKYWKEFIPEQDGPDKGISGANILRGLHILQAAALNDHGYASRSIALEQERCNRLSEFGEACSFFFEEIPAYDESAVAKWLKQPHVKKLFELFEDKLDTETEPSKSGYEEIGRALQIEFGFEKLGPIVHPLRVALTGRIFGPGLWELMEVLGKDRILKRLNHAETLAA